MNPGTLVKAPSGSAPATAAQAVRLVPFVRASYEHNEPMSLDISTLIGVNTVLLGPVDVPSFGYFESLLILVEALTGGTGAAAVYREDAPWASLQEVLLSDVNGAPIVQLSGYELYLAHKWGGYAGNPDPTVSPAYITPTTAGHFSFLLRVPVQISTRDGLGSLPNMNSSSTYRLRVTQAGQADIYSTVPTTMPTMRVRGWLEAWASPGALSPGGAPQSIEPPAINTTQMWSRYTYNVSAGFNVVPFRRVGNAIRNIILVFRTTAPARSTTNFPDPGQLFIDSRLLYNEARLVRQHYMRERSVGVAALDTGVFVYDYTHDMDNLLGGEMRDQWMLTASSTRLELQGTFGAAGSLTIITNDVQVVGNPYIG